MKIIRKHREFAIDILVYTLYTLAVICAFLWLSNNHMVLSKLWGINDTVTLNLDSITSMLGIGAAALAIIISNDNKLTKNRNFRVIRCTGNWNWNR